MTESLERSTLEFLWQAHAAQEDWTAKVDVKASLLLAANAAAITVIAMAFQMDRAASAAAPPCLLVSIAILGFLSGTLLAGAAVFPLLGPSKTPEPGLIYFGHVRTRTQEEYVKEALSADSQAFARQVAEQVHAMAGRNWLKHRLVQAALICSGLGLLASVAAALLTS